MRLVSYLKEGHDQLAVFIDGYLYDMEKLHPDLPNNMSMFLNYWDESLSMAMGGAIMVKEGKISTNKGIAYDQVQLLAPVPFPASFRVAAGYRQDAHDNLHLQTAVEPFPAFHFANHHSIVGAGEVNCMPDHLNNLDAEMQLAIVICKHGRNIRAADAAEYIGGLMVMNAFNAIQQTKDGLLSNHFLAATGPWLVTTDEFELLQVPAKNNQEGYNWNLRMQCFVNAEQLLDCNAADMDRSFAEMIESASYGVDLIPGDIISSGVTMNGSFLSINNQNKSINSAYKERWLKETDIIEMEIEGLGRLNSQIAKDEDDFSIVSKNG